MSEINKNILLLTVKAVYLQKSEEKLRKFITFGNSMIFIYEKGNGLQTVERLFFCVLFISFVLNPLFI